MNLRIGLYCLLGGLCFTVFALGNGHFAWWLLAGVVLSAAFVPVARFGPRHPLAQFGAIALTLVVVGVVCTYSEAILFYPEKMTHMLREIAGSAGSHLLVAAVLAVLAWKLKLTEPTPAIVARRSTAVTIPMVLLSALLYMIYYVVFGGITYTFLTKQYYPHAQEMMAHVGSWFWVYQFARGTLMVLAMLPVIYSLRLPRWKAAMAVGTILWLGGGCAALLAPSTMMVTAQRYDHILEIFTQNFSLGVSAVLLLRPRAAKTFMQSTTSA